MVAASKRLVPKELANKVSTGLVGLAMQRTVVLCVFIPLAIWMVFGPIAGRVDHNAMRYLFGPIVYPGIAVLCLLVFPLVPYRGNPRRYAGGGTKPMDASDPVALRLVAIFGSGEAKRFVVRIAMKLSGALLGSMLFLMILVRHSLSWSLYSFWFIPAILGATLSCWLVLATEYLDWGFKTWAREYDDHRHTKSSSFD